MAHSQYSSIDLLLIESLPIKVLIDLTSGSSSSKTVILCLGETSFEYWLFCLLIKSLFIDVKDILSDPRAEENRLFLWNTDFFLMKVSKMLL